jgi:hypothetical protein
LSGHCLEIDPDWGGLSVQPQIGGVTGAGTLSCPAAIGVENAVLCTAATRVISAALWRLGETQTTCIQIENPVNAVAFSPEGDALALGLGRYPLSRAGPEQAEVALYATADVSQALRKTKLPGVAVDRLVFDSQRDLLIAITGARSQDRGQIVVLDPHTLICVDMAETDFVFGRFLEIDSASDRLILAHREGLEVRPLDRLWKIECEWRSGGQLYGAAYDHERGLIFVSSGEVLDLDCKCIGNLPVLQKCTGLVLLDDGQLAGISQNGVLRVWETTEWEPE